MQQEQWINEVMKSLNGLKKEEGNPFLHTRVMAKLEKPNAEKGYNLKPVYILSMFAILVLLLNVFSWTGNRVTNEQDSVTTLTTTNDYELTDTDY
jgi:hypothetical protein